jgi:hypothetical protein
MNCVMQKCYFLESKNLIIRISYGMLRYVFYKMNLHNIVCSNAFERLHCVQSHDMLLKNMLSKGRENNMQHATEE